MDVQVSRAQDAQERPCRIKGFALITAIFLLVVLSLLAFYLLSLSGTQQFTGLWAVQGSRALYAARSGIQWGAWQALRVPGSPCNGTIAVDAGASTPFEVAVSCTSTTHDELGVSTQVWDITATATSGDFGDPGYVRRTVQTTVSNP